MLIDSDIKWLQLAIDLSRNAPLSHSAFSVGAILVKDSIKLASGFSREDGSTSHAEELAIEKATMSGIQLNGSTIYSSLEPCTTRSSRPISCSDLIVSSGIARVVFALREPPIFVNCRGMETLIKAGIEVVEIPKLAIQVAQINSHLNSFRK